MKGRREQECTDPAVLTPLEGFSGVPARERAFGQ